MDHLPASKKQIAAMGERLRQATQTVEDERLLRETLAAFDDVRQDVYGAVMGLPWYSVLGTRSGLAITSRTKTRSTLIDKLRRAPEIKLPYVRDIAGIRIVADVDLSGQDLLASMVTGLGLLTNVRVIDRRSEPVQGYRALHVTGTVRGMGVEVQIRTALQASWANLYEGLGDRWGRSIRYGAATNVAEISSLDELAPDNVQRILPGYLRYVSLAVIARYERVEQQMWQQYLSTTGVDRRLGPRIRLASRSPAMLARFPEWAETVGSLEASRRDFDDILGSAATAARTLTLDATTVDEL